MHKHLLEDMTFEEFAAWSDDTEDPVILIPLGSQEIQGPMVPMGDFMLTRVIASEVAKQTGAVAAPTLPFGVAEYFRSVPGGIALSADAMRAVLHDMINSFLNHGFSRIVILNGHSGNYPVIDQVIRDIRINQSLIVPCINLWRSIPDDIWQKAHGTFGKAAFAHGGDPVTSVYLHYFPQLTRPERAKSPDDAGKLLGLPIGSLAGASFQGVEIGLPVNIDDRCPDGIAGGDPRQSSAEKGRIFAEHLTQFCTDFVEMFQASDPKAPKTN